MKSLKGFVLKELISAENEQTTEVHHPVKGNSMKIGSSFVCHLVFKGLNLVHFEISLNETNQVEIRNNSQASPISVNGETVLDKSELTDGDYINVLGHTFLWERQTYPDELEEDLEASYQLDKPDQGRNSEPRIVNHKWVANSKRNQSIHIGEAEVSSTTENNDGEEESVELQEEEQQQENVADKENQRPSTATIPETEDDEESEHEKTILRELTEHSDTAVLIDWNTPEAPQKSINFIDLNTPAKSETPVRTTPKTPKAATSLYKKVLNPRISIAYLESDFEQPLSGDHVQSTPMVDRSQGSSFQQSLTSNTVVDLSDISDSDQSTIVSNSVVATAAIGCPEENEIPEAAIDELFEDAEEVAKSDTNLQATVGENTLQISGSDMIVELDDEGDEFVPATQLCQLPTRELQLMSSQDNEEINADVLGRSTITDLEMIPEAINEDSPVLFDVEGDLEEEKEKQTDEEQLNNEPVIEDETPTTSETVESPEKEIKAKTFTPRKSMRTPKKIDKDRCCTPKSLSKVLLTEAAEQRRSPRVSRMNLSLRMEGTKVNTPIATRTPKNLSKSLMVSKLQSAKKSALQANKSVVEIPDSDSEEEDQAAEVVANETMAEGEEGVVLLADETIASRSQVSSPALFDETANDSDVIVINSPYTPDVLVPKVSIEHVKIEQPEPVTSTNAHDATVEETQEDSIDNLENVLEVSKEIKLAMESDSEEEKTATVAEIGEEVPIVEDVPNAEDVPYAEDVPIEDEVPIAPDNIANSSIPDSDVLVQEMYKSPMKTLRLPVEGGENSPASLQKTPKGKELMTDEKLVRSPLQNVSNMVGVRELFKTPKPDAEKYFTGLREMMKTPQTVMHVTSSVGIKEWMKTPGRLFNNDVNMVGVKELLKTPKMSSEVNLVGVKELVNTPMPQKEKNFTGLREMMQTPKTSNESQMLGVKELMNTPMPPVNVNTVGVKELFNTPQVVRDPNTMGVRELLKTPAAPKGDAHLGPDLKEMLETPKPSTSAAPELVEEIGECFKTPAPIKITKALLFEEELKLSSEVIPEVNEETVEEKLEVDQTVDEVIAEPQDNVTEEPQDIVTEELQVDPVHPEEKEQVVESITAEEDNETTSSAEDQLAGQLNVEVVESVSMNTSAELFDKMMHRKSIKHTYSRKSTTPVKGNGKAQEQTESISPEKKEEVERWVESIIVSGSGQISAASTQKIVNNNLQVMSDRYSNVTPSQGQKSESLWKKPPIEEQEEEPQSKVEVANVKVSVDHVDEVEKREDNEVVPTEEIAVPVAVEEAGEAEPKEEEVAEKPKRGRRPLIKDAVVLETPKTPLRTRRNLKADLEDTPSAVTTPRTRRAASLKLEESSREVKTTPARRGRKPKVAETEALVEVVVPEEDEKMIAAEQDATVDESPVEPEVGPVVQEPEVAQEPEKKRGRPKAVKKLISQTDEEPSTLTPQKRGRRAKAVEQLAADPEVQVATPTRRGRKPAAAKTVEEDAPVVQQDVVVAEQAEEILKPESPVKRRGRGAKAAVVEQKTVEEKEDEPETPKPAARGRGRRAAPRKVERSESEQTATENEDAPKAPVARGRKKKVVAEPEQKTQVTESDASTVEQKTEEEEEQKVDDIPEKPKATRGKRVQIQLPTTDTDESPKKEEKPKRGRAPAQKRKVEVAASEEQQQSPEEAKSEEEKDKSDTEPVPAKKPARGRKAAVVQQEANDSVVSTPGKRRGRKPAAEKVDKETGELVVAAAPTRGRGKRAVAVVADDVAVETPKRVKKQESEDTEEREDEAEVEVEKQPKRRGRAKKEASVVDEEANVSTTSSKTTKGRGRKAKTATEAIKPVEESQSAESEKETTADESMAPPSRGKRTATKRAATADTSTVTVDEESETSRPTRATRRKN